MPTISQLLSDSIRDVPDFPKPGILFKDISPILSDPALLRHSMNELTATSGGQKIDKVVGIDARGFIFAAPVALNLEAGFVPVRKKGKLPWQTHEMAYSLEYGENIVEIHKDAIQPGESVLLIDDLLATGGTAAAAIKLIKQLDANLVAASFLIELTDLNGRELLGDTPVNAIISY
ncbi:adenine phosphoribosyltransferase [Verrucomicrobiaceae bacterium R5-34]|uniref:Adenine phosphoribosyltransferase n=1 Tax=Oceaniferula flava TaxID=2800421 RepID=A0AAE2VC85_9BACT|nr:adenine phosphoribosyltransferase [Oceaniferula flavus]MBK1830615.1 adenine phosphoribosyltransferase [Verrucomicrobiaceae bacterium R5-34]MBK1854711.1 adenine phosphoribosyltransferase [Oceaniferula flavus]MBM1136017.1 adenine phosphoribosyltransferase [Oceaniferula flavus]